jgi:hypothetical protein
MASATTECPAHNRAMMQAPAPPADPPDPEPLQPPIDPEKRGTPHPSPAPEHEHPEQP